MKYFVLVSTRISLWMISLSLFLFITNPAFVAQAPCSAVYGGGQQTDGSSYCLELVQAAETAPTQTPGFHTPNDTMVNSGQVTKGGYPAPAVNRQPNTGPEMLGIFALIPAAFAGWKLRKKASK